MASEDVIELGSSDDESEPVPKKHKPLPNAMVHIPKSYSGMLQIGRRNASGRTNKGSFGKQIQPAFLTSSVIKNPFATLPKKPIKISNGVLIQNTWRAPAKMVPQSPIVNPENLFSNKPLQIKNVKTLSKQSIKTYPPAKIAVMKAQGQKCLNSLPPGITVTRTKGPTSRKRTAQNSILPKVMIKKQKFETPKTIIGTVELDDDDVPTESSTTTHSWYVRPEDQLPEKSLENKNNVEPDVSKYIEIVIEDSPVKQLLDRRASEIGRELAITIDDSPVKLTSEKNNTEKSTSSGSEEEKCTKTPHSKKKLQYPMEEEKANISKNLVEGSSINLQPPTDKTVSVTVVESVQTESFNKQIADKTPIANIVSTKDSTMLKNNAASVIEIPESPAKKTDNLAEQSTPVNLKDVEKSQEIYEIVDLDTEIGTDSEEFHPVYQTFIDLCFQLENSDDMKKIVEKKIKAYYRQVPKEYTASEEFTEMVSSKIVAMQAGPDKMYLYIKDIVDELNLQRKMAKTQMKPQTLCNVTDNIEDCTDSKRKGQIRKLEKTLKKLHRAIQKLEEQEVDFDDETDSVYLLTERYKERLIRVHAKLCQLTNTKMPSEPRVHIEPKVGQAAGPARRLEKWINRRVPVGTPLPFPDFHDVLRCVREANVEDKLNWNDADVMEEARDLFIRCGKKLQRRRQENEWRIASLRITTNLDPAENDEDLKRKLQDNGRVASQREADVINKFADRQNQLKLEAVEIAEQEAENSPIESDDDVQEVPNHNETVKNEEESMKKSPNKDKTEESMVVVCDGESKEIKNSISDNESKENVNVVKDVNLNKLTKIENKNEIDKEIKEVLKNGFSTDIASKTYLEVSSDDSENRQAANDGDELQLLKKLHSETEILTSTLESSDSDTPIAISDTLESSDDNRVIGNSSDVVSIAFSSSDDNDSTPCIQESQNDIPKDSIQNPDCQIIEAGNSVEDCLLENDDADLVTNKKRNSNEEYSEPIEDILLASTDEESNCGVNNMKCTPEIGNELATSVDLKDGEICISATIVQEENESISPKDKPIETSSVETSSMDTADVNSQDNNDVKTAENVMLKNDSNESKKNFAQEELPAMPAEEDSANLSAKVKGNVYSEDNTKESEDNLISTIHKYNELEEQLEIMFHSSSQPSCKRTVSIKSVDKDTT